MGAEKGELMVDPVDGAWWLWVYLGYAAVGGGAYALYAMGAPGWQVALLIVMIFMVFTVWTRQQRMKDNSEQ